jgi:hypothetical protein
VKNPVKQGHVLGLQDFKIVGQKGAQIVDEHERFLDKL